MATIARCDCGALVIEVSGPPVVQLTCHCHECQAFSGQDYVDGAFFRKDCCKIQGETRPQRLKGGTGSDKVHHACAACGTPLYVQVDALNGAVAILASRLSPFEFKSEAHVWTSQKAEGVELQDDIERTLERPPDEMVERMIKGFWS